MPSQAPDPDLDALLQGIDNGTEQIRSALDGVPDVDAATAAIDDTRKLISDFLNERRRGESFPSG